jgi:hypothetical protein
MPEACSLKGKGMFESTAARRSAVSIAVAPAASTAGQLERSRTAKIA